jgi:predicted nucleic acid-binding protein
VVVSAFYDPDSVPGRIIDAGTTGRVALCAPESVRLELIRVLCKVMDWAPIQATVALQAVRIEWVPAGIFADRLAEALALLRDPDDAPVLALAMAIGCDIISGDRDLQVVKVKGIRIWRPSEFEGRP